MVPARRKVDIEVDEFLSMLEPMRKSSPVMGHAELERIVKRVGVSWVQKELGLSYHVLRRYRRGELNLNRRQAARLRKAAAVAPMTIAELWIIAGRSGGAGRVGKALGVLRNTVRQWMLGNARIPFHKIEVLRALPAYHPEPRKPKYPELLPLENLMHVPGTRVSIAVGRNQPRLPMDTTECACSIALLGGIRKADGIVGCGKTSLSRYARGQVSVPISVAVALRLAALEWLRCEGWLVPESELRCCKSQPRLPMGVEECVEATKVLGNCRKAAAIIGSTKLALAHYTRGLHPIPHAVASALRLAVLELLLAKGRLAVQTALAPRDDNRMGPSWENLLPK